MDKPILDPDDFFAKITSLVKTFTMKGHASLDTTWRAGGHLKYTMSWNIDYSYGEEDNSCRSSTFMPHTFAGLMHKSERLNNRDLVDPLTELSQYAAPWIEEDNALLANCVEIHNENNLIITPCVGGSYRVRQSLKKHSLPIVFVKDSWQDVLNECVFQALSAGSFSFYQFERCSPFNQQRVLSVLRERPVHNDETAQMYKVDLTNEVAGMTSRSRVARKL